MLSMILRGRGPLTALNKLRACVVQVLVQTAHGNSTERICGFLISLFNRMRFLSRLLFHLEACGCEDHSPCTLACKTVSFCYLLIPATAMQLRRVFCLAIVRQSALLPCCIRAVHRSCRHELLRYFSFLVGISKVINCTPAYLCACVLKQCGRSSNRLQ